MTSKLDGLPLLEPASRQQWRAWLQAHHADSAGVWLAIGKKGNSVTELDYEQAIEEALCFGWIDSAVGRLDDNRFKQRMTPRKRGSAWAPSNKERWTRLVAQGLVAPAGITAIEAAKTDGSWTLLDDVEALIMPADLAQALAMDEAALSSFAALPPSTRKQILYWVASAKRPATRTKRIGETVAAAAEHRPVRQGPPAS
ncbi:MAG: YdeI/OmpD-associated family protein [Ramlibacter sp.]|nr:YdeI/OmpD-associated family protein [Cryobacterium sp.]